MAVGQLRDGTVEIRQLATVVIVEHIAMRSWWSRLCRSGEEVALQWANFVVVSWLGWASWLAICMLYLIFFHFFDLFLCFSLDLDSE